MRAPSRVTEQHPPAEVKGQAPAGWRALSYRFSARWVLAGGLLLYLALQAGLVLTPASRRPVPVEADDGYTYILKAEQLLTCFRQDCPALESLRPQLLAPTEDPGAAWLRYREYHRAFSIYHPLHSVLLAGLHGWGLSWENSYDVLAVSGSIFIGLALAAWLSALWGPGPAGIALALLAFMLFPGQGLHYVVPTNLALGVALLTWAGIASRKERAGWILVAGTLAMVSMHAAGRLYAALALALFWLLAGKRLDRSGWAAAGAALSILILAFLLPLLVSRPDLSVRPDPPPPGWTLAQGLAENLSIAAGVVAGWAGRSGSPWMAGLLILLGLISLPGARRGPVLAHGLLLAALAFASLFYVLPRYPGDAFGRVWVPLAMWLAGLTGQAIWAWLVSAWAAASSVRSSGFPEFGRREWMLSPQGWGLAALAFIGLLLLGTGLPYLWRGYRDVAQTAAIMTDNQHTTLDPAQPALLPAEGCGQVLYMSEVPMHFYFAHGALRCEAVYYPALQGTPEKREWVSANNRLQYAVAWNPAVASERITGGSSLALLPGDQLGLALPGGRPLNTVKIYLENPGGESTLAVRFQTASGEEGDCRNRTAIPAALRTRLVLPAGWKGWLPLGVEEGPNNCQTSINLRLAEGGRVRVRGLRLGPDGPYNWPWDQQVILEHLPGDPGAEPRLIQFETGLLFPDLGLPVRILADGGDTVLAEITP